MSASGRLAALLWDVDGTLAETERDGHRVAFNRAFDSCGLPWRWEDRRYGELLRVSGGFERLMHDMAHRADAPASLDERTALARAIHTKKNALYADLVRNGAIPLRQCVMALMRECREHGLAMGITTTTSRANVEALLSVHIGARWREWFAVVVCGEDVGRKRPDPEVYARAVAALGLSPHQALAIEDSPVARQRRTQPVCPSSWHAASASRTRTSQGRWPSGRVFTSDKVGNRRCPCRTPHQRTLGCRTSRPGGNSRSARLNSNCESSGEPA